MIKFIGSFEVVRALPRAQFHEYAFVGRSNVGKSSLINAIAGSVIARTSKTPGRTQTLNLFNFDDKLAIMDLPGYGYAKNIQRPGSNVAGAIGRIPFDSWSVKITFYFDRCAARGKKIGFRNFGFLRCECNSLSNYVDQN